MTTATLPLVPTQPAPYAPGLHILATFRAPAARLRDAAGSQLFFTGLVNQLGLTSVGEVYHVFAENAGFTAVLALTESHLSLHTWPEHGLATFDIFLSNFRQDNHATVRAAYQATLVFCGPGAGLYRGAAMSESATATGWVACPQCTTQLPCHDPTSSRYFGCFQCRTFFRANPVAPASGAQRLDGFKQPLEPGPSLPLGAVAELGGYRCRLTGYQVRGEKQDRTAEWREYQLRPAEPLPGDEPANFPLQLAEYQGHWLLIRRAGQGPDAREPRSAQDGSWEDATGRNYTLWHRYQPLVRDALGEFDWNILDDEDLWLAEYVSPPYQLVSEQLRDAQPSWYLAEYLEPERVAQAFGMPTGQLPVCRGVGAAQPNPTQGWPLLVRLAGLGAALLMAAQLVIFALKPAVEGAQEFTVFEADRAGYQQMIPSKSFQVSGPSALAVTLEVPDLTNHWVEVTASLVNEQTGRGYEFTRSIEYYEGTEGGERWTKGSRTTEAVLSAVPSGRYHFNFYPTVDKGTVAVALNLRIKENTPLWSNFFLVLGGLSLLPMGVWWRRRNFERDRWSNSDFNPYATEE